MFGNLFFEIFFVNNNIACCVATAAVGEEEKEKRILILVGHSRDEEGAGGRVATKDKSFFVHCSCPNDFSSF